MAASTARLAARRLFLPWSTRLVRTSGSGHRVGGGARKGRGLRRAPCPGGSPRWCSGRRQGGGGIGGREARCTLGFVVTAGTGRGAGRSAAAVHAGSCSLRPAELRDEPGCRSHPIESPAGPTRRGWRRLWSRSGAALGRGRHASERGSSGAPRHGHCRAHPGGLGKSLNPPLSPGRVGATRQP